MKNNELIAIILTLNWKLCVSGDGLLVMRWPFCVCKCLLPCVCRFLGLVIQAIVWCLLFVVCWCFLVNHTVGWLIFLHINASLSVVGDGYQFYTFSLVKSIHIDFATSASFSYWNGIINRLRFDNCSILIQTWCSNLCWWSIVRTTTDFNGYLFENNQEKNK